MSRSIWDEPHGSYLTYPEIVEANRSGQITEIQRGILWSNVRMGLVGPLVSLALFGLFLFFELFMAQPARHSGSQRGSGLLVILFIGLFIIGARLFYATVVQPGLDALNLLRDLMGGEIDQGEGVVAWAETEYEARCAGRRLSPLVEKELFRSDQPGIQVLLPLGRYRFFYFPRSGIILSAQPLPRATPEPLTVVAPAPTLAERVPTMWDTPLVGAPSSSDHEGESPSSEQPTPGFTASSRPMSGGASDLPAVLAAAHGFGSNDLAENRAGRLTPRQQERLTQRGENLRRNSLLAGLVGVAFMVAMGAFLSSGAMILGAFVVAGLGLWITNVRSNRFFEDAESGKVFVLEGPVTKSFTNLRSQTFYHYHLGTLRFPVTLAAYNVLPEGLRCRVYFTKASRTVLCVEPLDWQH